jgi:hypothetical protein
MNLTHIFIGALWFAGIALGPGVVLVLVTSP